MSASEHSAKDGRMPYEAPDISSLPLRAMNRFACGSYGSEAFTRIAGLKVEELLERHGSPLYLSEASVLREGYRGILDAFAKRYGNTRIGWSYKTNYLTAICALYRNEGAWAEVVSGFEYSIARDLGVPGEQIIFNGPHKTVEETRQALIEGALLNLDSFDEIDQTIAVARELGGKYRVGIRVNMQLNYPPWDKFGFNLESGQAAEAARRLQGSGVLSLRGLHIHCGTYITDLSIYEKAVERMISLAHKVESDHGVEIEYIDMGGGYASRNTLLHQFLPGEATCPTFEQYAEVIAEPMTRARAKFSGEPILIIEPGRSIVDEGMSLLCRVVSVKRMSGGIKGLVLDAGVNLLPTTYWYKHEIVAAKSAAGPLEEYHVFGALCMQIDVIRQCVQLPPMRPGDAVVIRSVGAYNYSQGMSFIYPRAGFVMVDEGEVAVIREREDAHWIRALDRLPAFLASEENRGCSVPASGDA